MGEPVELRAPLRCVPGTEKKANDLLVALDEYTVSVDELLHEIPSYKGNITTELRLLSWAARECFAPHLLDGVTPKRLLITRVDLTTYTSRQLLSVSTDTVADCVLVSSLREDGSHQPALDLDYPAALYRDEQGITWLNLQVSSPAVDYHGREAVDWADAAMAHLGLTRAGGKPDGKLVDLANYGRVASALGATWDSDFESLWEISETLEEPHTFDPDRTGAWYQVEGGATIVPSTSWWHLYLDRILPEGSYLAAVDALAGCGLLNPGFANGSRDRGFTSLRRPGLLKPPKPTPEELYADVPF